MNPLNTVNGTIIGGIVLAVLIGLVTGGGIAFNTASFLVWIHVLAGITWIGLLYYFNFNFLLHFFILPRSWSTLKWSIASR